MLRLIIAAVLVSACLAFPQKKDDVPADTPNLQSFGPAGPAMFSMQGTPMLGMSGGGVPFNPNFGVMGYKRDLNENLEKRKQHSKMNENNISPFGPEAGLGNFMNFVKETDNKVPFDNVNNGENDLEGFQSSTDNKGGKFRFFDEQQ